MDYHVDHIHSIFDNDYGVTKGVPILSIVGVLNNDFEGGAFTMFDDYEINLDMGDVVLFPSSFVFPHKVNTIEKGTRYSFVSWVFEGKRLTMATVYSIIVHMSVKQGI